MINIKKWLEYYENLFPLSDGQLDFFKEIGKNYDSPVKYLSVECGTALLSQKLSSEGYDVTVTDRFPEVTSMLKNKNVNQETNVHIFNLLPQDIGRYLGKSFFNVIYCANYRLIFIYDKIYIQKLMLDAKNLLSKDGCLIFDLLNFSKYDFVQDKVELHTRTSELATLYSTITIDKENITYLLNQQIVTSSNKIIDVIKSERISPISLESLKKLALDCGFSSFECYSDFKKSPYRADTDKIIVIIRK